MSGLWYIIYTRQNLINKSGAVSGRRQPCFSNPKQIVNLLLKRCLHITVLLHFLKNLEYKLRNKLDQLNPRDVESMSCSKIEGNS